MDSQKTRRDFPCSFCLQWRMLEQRVRGPAIFARFCHASIVWAVGIKQRLGDAEARELCNSVSRSVEGLIALLDRAGRDGSGLDCRPAMHALGLSAMALGRMIRARDVEPGRLVELDIIMASRPRSSGGGLTASEVKAYPAKARRCGVAFRDACRFLLPNPLFVY